MNTKQYVIVLEPAVAADAAKLEAFKNNLVNLGIRNLDQTGRFLLVDAEFQINFAAINGIASVSEHKFSYKTADVN